MPAGVCGQMASRRGCGNRGYLSGEGKLTHGGAGRIDWTGCVKGWTELGHKSACVNISVAGQESTQCSAAKRRYWDVQQS